MGASVQNKRGKGGTDGRHAEQVQVQAPGMGAGADSAKRARNEPKKHFFGGTGIRGPTQKWGSGVPHKIFVPPAVGGAPHLKEVWGGPHPIFAKCGLPHRQWGSL
ncbi:hypothetical protein B0H14DRAFT_2625589 [Mycena olivaceomarginata]|nr:hypothetical protein B0H14DRAFT_2625589 [Mycena olivaceomarginata]